MASAISPEKESFKVFLKKVEIEEIDSDFFILNKVLVGDKGDSVPSVWETVNGTRTMGFTPKKAESVHEAFKSSEWKSLDFKQMLDSVDFLNWLSGMVLRSSKSVDSSDNREKVKSNIQRNFKLMWLNQLMIPDFVASGCNLEIERGVSLLRKPITLDRIKILEGTEWVTSGYQPKGFDPFEHILD
jgi:hypothetical protein